MCGKVGGDPFVNVTRPNIDGDCPTNFEPCSKLTVANETLCYPPEELESSCPITDLQIVNKDQTS